MSKNAEKGFTLVEVVLTAILLSVLVLGAFSLFMMYSESTRETAAYLKMQRQSEAVLDEIARKVRVASEIKPVSGFSVACGADADGNPLDCATAIEIKEDAATTTFAFSNGEVMMDGKRFNIPGSPITVENDSKFEIVGPQRLKVDMHLKIEAISSNNKTFNLRVNRGTFQCRN